MLKLFRVSSNKLVNNFGFKLNGLGNVNNTIKNKFKYHLVKNFCKKTETKKIGWIKSMKKKIKMYGMFGLYLYIASYIATFGVVYMLTKWRVINPDSLLDKLKDSVIDRMLDIEGLKKSIGPAYVEIVVAVVINEILEVVRLPAIVLILPKLAKRFKKK